MSLQSALLVNQFSFLEKQWEKKQWEKKQWEKKH
jgi:hypothetical protein